MKDYKKEKHIKTFNSLKRRLKTWTLIKNKCLTLTPFNACDCTCTTSLIHVKNSITTSIYDAYYLGHWNEENERRAKTSNLIVDCFLLTFINLLWAWLLYFHVLLWNKGKFLVWSEYYNQFGIYQPSFVLPIEPQQNNLNNPEAYSKPCQTFKM